MGVVALATCLAGEARAQVLLSEGFSYKQNFDSLASSGTGNPWIDNSTLPGWYADRGISGPLSTYDAGAGSSTAGSLYSFGTGTDPERALGSLASGATGSLTYGVRFQNDTLSSVQGLTISYAGEQWRDNNNATAQTLELSYRVSSSPITSADALTPPGSGGWIPFKPLDFTSPVHSGGSGALDGNAPANRTVFVGTLVAGALLNPGDELFIRWFDADDTGFDHALAIDDLSVTFTAVPEPGEYGAAVALGLLGFALFRRYALKRP